MATHEIKYGSVFGNFAWSASAQITDEQAVLLAPLGALQIAQRTPSTGAEKLMAGYEKRPKAFKRTDIPYTDEGAEILRKAHQTLVIEVGEGKDKQVVKIPAEVEVAFYEGSGTEPKFKDEKEIRARHETTGDLAVWAKNKVNYEGEDLTEGNVEFLSAIKAFKLAALKGM